ncbi:hypothetical protein B0H19DRAFT_1145694 [Mycena capillaripes]|nr:hypothetical protein B0H19DRAFT_1145694 [Mycena capillaripes]
MCSADILHVLFPSPFSFFPLLIYSLFLRLTPASKPKPEKTKQNGGKEEHIPSACPAPKEKRLLADTAIGGRGYLYPSLSHLSGGWCTASSRHRGASAVETSVWRLWLRASCNSSSADVSQTLA